MDHDNVSNFGDYLATKQLFPRYLANQTPQIDVYSFIYNMILAALLAYCLSIVYKKYGTSLSNRRTFSGNFILLATTTMLIISVVKSSLALSLGLVGALSIVRFRAAIKEPEELSYLFLTIAIGLGMGADQRVITILAFVFIVLIIFLKSYKKEKIDSSNLFLTISGAATEKIYFKTIVEVLKKYCVEVNLQRFDENQNSYDLSFIVQFSNHEELDNCKTDLQNIYPSINISFLDYKGLGAN